MIYKSTFYPVNSNSKYYLVLIITNNDTSREKEIILADDPVTIELRDSKYFFGPIKQLSATIRIITESPYYDIYSSSATGTAVKITEYVNGSSPVLIFDGYVTPNAYNQDFVYKDRIEIECVGVLSILKYYDYVPVEGKGKEGTILLSDVIYKSLQRIGIETFRFWSSYHCQDTLIPEFLTTYINENNFFDDLNHDPLNLEDVLSEVLKFFGLCMFWYNSQVYIVDYYALNNPSLVFAWGDRFDWFANPNIPAPLEISKSTIKGANHTISLDETYNKISITANTYVLEESAVAPEMLNKGSLSNILDPSQDRSHLTAQDDEYYYYIKPYQNKESPTWYYRSNVSKVSLGHTTELEYDDADNIGVTRDWTNQTFSYTKMSEWAFDDPNTIGGNIIQTATKTKNDSGDLSDWDTYHSFHIWPEGTEFAKPYVIQSGPERGWSLGIGYLRYWQYLDLMKLAELTRNKCLMRYTSPSYNTFIRSESATTYIVLSGQAKLSSTVYDSKTAEAEELNYKKNNKNGYSLLRAKLKIGDKYWNGSRWVSDESFFNLSFGKSSEKLKTETWINFTKEDTGFNLIEHEGNIIPITQEDGLVGSISLEIYPLIIEDLTKYLYGTNKANGSTGGWFNVYYSDTLGEDYDHDYRQENTFLNFCKDTTIHDAYTGIYEDTSEDYPTDKKMIVYTFADTLDSYLITPFVLVKDFNISLETAVGNFFDNNEDTPIDDTEYFNIIDENFVNEMDSIEIKVNTQNPDKKVSLSSVLFSPGTDVSKAVALTKMQDLALGTPSRTQEYNLVERYYLHYYYPKKVLNLNINQYAFPGNYVYYRSQFGDKKFIVNEEEWSLETGVNNIKISEL